MERILGASLLLGLLGCGSPGSGPDREVDLLVFAPHPDDESLGCAGLLHRIHRRGGRAVVAVFTQGDGFPAFASLITGKPADRLGPDEFKALAAFRRRQSEAAWRAVGGAPGDLRFLGYPDSGLLDVYRNRGTDPYLQRFTRQLETYGTDRTSPYTHDAVLADVVALLSELRPARIAVTHEADAHADHRAAFLFVRDAVEKTGYRGPLDAYLIHGGPEWPWPAEASPEAPFEARDVGGVRSPRGVPWPPPRRVPLDPADRAAKEQAVRAQASHLVGDLNRTMLEERAYLLSFVKSEEVFWPVERR
jgi:LmbE family N-acetylglucosaminyl deacetylase